MSQAATSRANITRAMPVGTTGATADGWFRVDAEGASGSNVGFFRFFDGSNRIADVYRQNGTGELWFRTTNSSGAFVYTSLGLTAPLGQWIHVGFHVIAAGSASTIEVWIDDVRRYSNTHVWLPTSRLTTLLLGSEHQSQQMDLRIDDVTLRLG